MTILTLISPEAITSHFTVPADETKWDGEYHDTVYKNGKKSGKSPVRNRATFSTKSKALVPKTPMGRSLQHSLGLYFVTFDIPCPAFYIGIAAKSKSPEGILSRLQKHRVKATASHVGLNPNSNGGINHTEGWRPFAIKRYRYFRKNKQSDECSDMKFSYGELADIPVHCTHKAALEYIENTILQKVKEDRGAIASLLWPSYEGKDILMLTSSTNQGQKPALCSVNFWDKLSVSID